jgi:hypothetical protein
VSILGLARQGKRLPGFSQAREIREGDFLVLGGRSRSRSRPSWERPNSMSIGAENQGGLMGKSLSLVEAIVPEESSRRRPHHAGTAADPAARGDAARVSRQGRRFRERVRKLPIKPGDVLLLIGPDNNIAAASIWLGVLPLENRRLEVLQRTKALAITSSLPRSR